MTAVEAESVAWFTLYAVVYLGALFGAIWMAIEERHAKRDEGEHDGRN